ncbi:hypothetical protein ACFYSC_33240 [Streptosporangium sp. NPDC004379]|uniref:hypothetical protein n=1 Tax=Streptosporangium sp. NPDC004379 TaxID=3366189 RepID=UPI0036AB56AE
MDWGDLPHDPVECAARVDAAFERSDPEIGRVVVGLSLCHPDAEAIAPRARRALASDQRELRCLGLTAVSHMVRRTGEIDDTTLETVRGLLRDPAREVREYTGTVLSDVWIFVSHSRLPGWLSRRERMQGIKWWFVMRWTGVSRRLRLR